MPRARKLEPIAPIEAKPVELIKTEFIVLNADGGEMRSYTHELHGEMAEQLAHQFAKKIGGSVA